MLIITWSIFQLNCVERIDTKTKVVVSANWRAFAEDGEYTSQIQSITNITLSDNSFTEYDNLTESQVVEWIKASLGQQQLIAIEQNLKTQIFLQKYPERISPELPW